jgi:hypothetical protein
MGLNRFGFTLAEVERELFGDARRCDGIRTRTAKFLGISLRCLRMKLRDFAQNGSMLPPPTVARPNTFSEVRTGVRPTCITRQADSYSTRSV